MTDDLEKRFLDMTPAERLGEKRLLELSIAINKAKLDDMTRALKRLRIIDFDIEYRKKELAVLEKQKLQAEKEAEFVFA